MVIQHIEKEIFLALSQRHLQFVFTSSCEKLLRFLNSSHYGKISVHQRRTQNSSEFSLHNGTFE